MLDWPDWLLSQAPVSGPEYLRYNRSDITTTARAFFHACALEDYAAIEWLLDLRTLAALRSRPDEGKATELHGQINFTPEQVKQLRAEPGTILPEDPRAEWEALETSLRGDWPGKSAKLKALVLSWNRYPLVRLTVQPGMVAAGVSGPAHFLTPSFEGAPERNHRITIVPRAVWSDEPERYEISSLPPWWNDEKKELKKSSSTPPPTPTRVTTKPGTFEIAKGLKLVIEETEGGQMDPKPFVDALLVWESKDDPDRPETYDFRLSEGLPFVIGWNADGTSLWVICGVEINGKEKKGYMRILSVNGPGDVAENMVEIDSGSKNTGQPMLPDDVLRVFESLGRAQPQSTPSSTTIAGTMNDNDLKNLPWHAFDQTPGKYWRELADVRRFTDAANLIEQYLALHPELEKGVQRINGSNLHFHAAQCWAFADEKERAMKHLAASMHAGSDGDFLWNDYVEGTCAFLQGDRPALLAAHEKLAKSKEINKPNLAALDRLIANFGKPYFDAYNTDNQDHQKLSADCFNQVWELLEKKDRSQQDDEHVISLAHASLAHWRMRDDCKDQNLSIGYWQISRVYAVLGQGENAKRYGELCLAISGKEPPFYLAYAHEALARAALVLKDRISFNAHLADARAFAAKVTDPDERKMLEDDLDGLNWP